MSSNTPKTTQLDMLSQTSALKHLYVFLLTYSKTNLIRLYMFQHRLELLIVYILIVYDVRLCVLLIRFVNVDQEDLVAASEGWRCTWSFTRQLTGFFFFFPSLVSHAFTSTLFALSFVFQTLLSAPYQNCSYLRPLTFPLVHSLHLFFLSLSCSTSSSQRLGLGVMSNPIGVCVEIRPCNFPIRAAAFIMTLNLVPMRRVNSFTVCQSNDF